MIRIEKFAFGTLFPDKDFETAELTAKEKVKFRKERKRLIKGFREGLSPAEVGAEKPLLAPGQGVFLPEEPEGDNQQQELINEAKRRGLIP